MQKIVISILLVLSLFICTSRLFATETEIDRATGLFLLSDYAATIQECKSLIVQGGSAQVIMQSYFLLGLSQMKEGKLHEARMNFRVLLRDFPKNKLAVRVHSALADTYFMEGNFQEALKIYEGILRSYPETDNISLIYIRLGQANLKLGNWQQSQIYLSKAKTEFSNTAISELAEKFLKYDSFFSVQVGSFRNYKGAKDTADKLSAKGYGSYIAEAMIDKDRVYRVRVGKLSTRQEAIDLKNDLSYQGYPTIIYP